jgi:hypothetical protein
MKQLVEVKLTTRKMPMCIMAIATIQLSPTPLEKRRIKRLNLPEDAGSQQISLSTTGSPIRSAWVGGQTKAETELSKMVIILSQLGFTEETIAEHVAAAKECYGHATGAWTS